MIDTFDVKSCSDEELLEREIERCKGLIKSFGNRIASIEKQKRRLVKERFVFRASCGVREGGGFYADLTKIPLSKDLCPAVLRYKTGFSIHEVAVYAREFVKGYAKHGIKVEFEEPIVRF